MIFRYPGAKNQHFAALAPFLDRLLEGRRAFHDVFAGGGSVLLHVAASYPRIQLHANDLDEDVAIFWKTVVGDQVGELCERLRIRPTIDLYYEIRDHPARTEVDRAFRVLFLNRTCFSGLIHGHPIGGPSQFSRHKIFSHYNGQQLVREIQEARDLLKGRTVVTCKDGAAYVREHLTAAKYLDPPYFTRGNYSYRQRMTLAGHVRLAEALRKAAKWVLSYDNCPAIAGLYSWAECYALSALYRVNQKAKKCVTGKELVIVPRA